MTHPQKVSPSLRLWPGVAAAVLLVALRVALPTVAPDAEIFGIPSMIFGIIGAVVCGLVIALWWLFFSRAPWSERVGAILLAAAAVGLTSLVAHPSIRGGMMGMMLPLYSIPVVGLAIVIATVASRRRSTGARRASLAIAIAAGCALFALIRTDGITGEGEAQFRWRWTPTAEQRLLAEAGSTPLAPIEIRGSTAAATPTRDPVPSERASVANLAPPVASPSANPPAAAPPAVERAASAAPVEWPGFRGARRDGVIHGPQIETDWASSPPEELWRRPLGPGWSSFAVSGDLIYTQEQRGEEEVVTCYTLSTGEPVWRHGDPVRFYESNGGAGPRGTPTVRDGRVYALGATGILNALDAATGQLRWSRNAAADANVTVPDWGIASSPLVVDDLVVVALSGRLAAYDRSSGALRWLGPTGGAGYSSPHLATIDGVKQVVLLRGSRTISLALNDGSLLWDHTWLPGVSIIQPALVADRDLVISAGDAMGGLGLRRLSVTRKAEGWTVEERWTTRGLKPYFNDLVVHKGHAYGFDGSILSAIDLGNGDRKWKGGRYGNGQMILLPEQDLLLVMSEDGELALVGATPDKFTEVARVTALNAKTWNHPVLVGDTLLVRNGEEMVAYRLPSSTSR